MSACDILYVSKVKPIKKDMLKMATEMQSHLKNKAPERFQRCSGVYLYIKQNFSRHILLQP